METARQTAEPAETGLKSKIEQMKAAVEAAGKTCRDAEQVRGEWERKHKEVKGQHDLLVSQNAWTGEDRENLRKGKETLEEQVETLKIENTELSDATKHTAGSNERVKVEMEEKQIQIGQLQDEISRCTEAEAAAAAETGNRREKTEEALQGRATLAEENLRETERELQRVEETCAQVMMLLEQAIWSPTKDIKWTTDGKSVLHAIRVMEMLGMGTIVVLIRVDDRNETSGPS